MFDFGCKRVGSAGMLVEWLTLGLKDHIRRCQVAILLMNPYLFVIYFITEF